ncbi:Gfo/Idh/MocA family oxidoreductase [Caballeronia sp. J97]|uniref:Gfo/Idh/MocA family protein n=1 Tax=Caballeronia sp. J97 TaxID=2805429 RepID=UPI002AAF31CA|nr:Gfo/Idh/MocA family oxidoreductase [Caballeronia sp. J97]
MGTASPRIAVAGGGLIGKRHIAVISQLRAGKLAAIVDPSPSSSELAQRYDVPHYPSLSELIAKDRPDGIVLATPNGLHLAHAMECIAAGIPTLVEKPIAHSVEAGLELCAAASARGVPILVGHNRRHSSVMAKAVEIVQSGILGKIVAVQASTLFYKAENEGYFDGEFGWRRLPGGGPMLLNLIHEIGNLRSLCGEIDAVQAFSSNATRKFVVEDTASITLRFTSGALGTLLLSDCAASCQNWEHTSGEDPRYDVAHVDDENCYHVAGTMGSLSLPTMRLSRYTSKADQSWHKPLLREQVPLDVLDPLVGQMEHFVDVIKGEAEPKVSAHDGLQNVRIVEAIIESARSGKTVAIR